MFSFVLLAILVINKVASDSHGCLSSAGYTYCESKDKCLRTWEEECPLCLSGRRWCYSSQECYFPVGGYCEDRIGSSYGSSYGYGADTEPQNTGCTDPDDMYCKSKRECIDKTDNCPECEGEHELWCDSQNKCLPLTEPCFDSAHSEPQSEVCAEPDDVFCKSKRECIDKDEHCPECGENELWCDSEDRCMLTTEHCADSDFDDIAVLLGTTLAMELEHNEEHHEHEGEEVVSGKQGHSYNYDNYNNGDSHGCLGSAGYTYCQSKDKCLRIWEEECPICLNNKRWCYSSQECYFPVGGYCSDRIGTGYGAQKVNEAMDTVKEKVKDVNVNKHMLKREIIATATFKSSESGVEGEVKVDENGNVFMNLDVKDLDISACKFEENEMVSFKYAIRNKWDYGMDDFVSRFGPDQCTMDVSGAILNPFRTPLCTEIVGTEQNMNMNMNMEMEMEMDMDPYFKCAIGDLSGRFGEMEPDDNNKLLMEENVSEQNGERVSGFCLSRLNPESLSGRSMVFMCKEVFLFCAPFKVDVQNMEHY